VAFFYTAIDSCAETDIGINRWGRDNVPRWQSNS
jgi:hypothetical protein